MEVQALENQGKPEQEKTLQQQEARNAIAALPDDLKETVLLVVVEELSHGEAAKILDVAEGTISWRINKAKKVLAKQFAKRSA